MTTISEHASDPQAFWDLVKERFLVATKTEKKVSAFWFCTLFWDKYKLKPYWGEWEERLGAIASDLAADYHWLDKREKFHEKVFADISKWWRLLDIGTVVSESGTDFTGRSNLARDNSQSQSGKRIVGQNKPQISVDIPNSFYGGHNVADYLATEMGIQSGVRIRDPKDDTGQKWITRPDFANTMSSSAGVDKGHSHLTRNIKTKQQPTQKISQILRCFKMVEYNIHDIFRNYWYHFQGFSTPQGKLIPDPYTGFYTWKTRLEIEEELPDAVRTKKKVVDEGYSPMTLQAWKAKFKAGEQVEEKLILENLKMYRKYLEKMRAKSSGKNEEMLGRNINYCDALRQAFERPLTWVSMEAFDEGMARINGYDNFKQQLRMLYAINRIKAEEGGLTDQVFLNLTGFPGVGKTMISELYAEVIERPIVVVGFASQGHPKIIDGISQSYQGAEIGRVLAAFVENKAYVNYTIKDLEDEYKMLENLPNVKAGKPTERQAYRMSDEKQHEKDSACLQAHIAYLKSQGLTSAKEERFSRAPVVVLDEYEKCGDKPTVRAVGNIATESSCQNFFDKFFGFTVDAREMTVIITCNYEHLIEPFIKSRFEAVLIDLPTYSARIKIGKMFVKKYTKRQFPHKEGELTDEEAEKGKLTEKQKAVISLFDHEFVKLTIDEGWGVREMDAIYDKKIFIWIRYLSTVYRNGNKAEGTLLDYLIDKKQNKGWRGLSDAKEMEAVFQATGNGQIVMKYFDDSDTTGEKPFVSWTYKRFTEPNVNPETGLMTQFVDSVIRLKGIVVNKDGTYDNWFEARSDKWKDVLDAAPKWWKDYTIKEVEGKEVFEYKENSWKLPKFVNTKQAGQKHKI